MDFNINWDVDKYKSPFESEEHWELRKSFLVAHKDKYPEDQLVCLAQVFFNIELLGCRYPEETMKLISDLSEGIADNYREKKQQKLQRTFVKASDAAGARLKGNLHVTVSHSSKTPINQNNQEFEPKQPDLLDDNKEIISVSFDEKNSSNIHSYFKDIIIMKSANENLFEHGISILQRSLSKSSIPFKFEFWMKGTSNEPLWECVLQINGENIAYATAKNKLTSKKAVIELLLFKLQDFCYTIEEKKKFLSDGSTVHKSDNKNETGDTPSETNAMENNIGCKLMKMMGWKGGGLGKTGQGISSPVVVQDQVKRSGFGANLTTNELMKQIQNKLESYAKTDSHYDLVFSSDFSKDERAKLHKMALKLHLKTRSYGKEADRHLVVSKASNQQSIIQTLMNCGGENEKYKLIPPSNF